MPRYHTVLFDADNTLLDFFRSEREALTDALRAAGVAILPGMTGVYSAINDALWKKLEQGKIEKKALRIERFVQFCAHYRLSVDASRLATAYTDFLSQKSYLMPHAVEVCRTLSAHCRLFVVTNGIASVQRPRFAASGLKPYFHGSFISEEIGAEKPSPAYFEAIAARIEGFLPSDTLLVGDSLTSDIKGGAAAGLDTCLYVPNGAVATSLPTYIVKDLRDLVPLVLPA